MELDTHGGDKQTQHQDHHSIQPVQKQKRQFRHIIPATTPVLHHKEERLTCLLILFRRDLIKQLKEWQMAGDRIILFMDHNKHVTKGALGKALGDRDGLDLCEAIIHHTGKSPGATFFRGSKPIDGLWVSDIDISNACVMPFGYGMGDHRAYILDIPIESLVGIDPVKIVQQAS
jgi:hypothetical protein